MKAKLTGKGFDWFKVLRELQGGAEISYSEHRYLSEKAGGWPTCACGQLCRELPRTSEGCPLDSILMVLGFRFNTYVKEQVWCKAMTTLEEIEHRTVTLLKEREIQNALNFGDR